MGYNGNVTIYCQHKSKTNCIGIWSTWFKSADISKAHVVKCNVVAVAAAAPVATCLTNQMGLSRLLLWRWYHLFYLCIECVRAEVSEGVQFISDIQSRICNVFYILQNARFFLASRMWYKSQRTLQQQEHVAWTHDMNVRRVCVCGCVWTVNIYVCIKIGAIDDKKEL